MSDNPNWKEVARYYWRREKAVTAHWHRELAKAVRVAADTGRERNDLLTAERARRAALEAEVERLQHLLNQALNHFDWYEGNGYSGSSTYVVDILSPSWYDDFDKSG